MKKTLLSRFLTIALLMGMIFQPINAVHDTSSWWKKACEPRYVAAGAVGLATVAGMLYWRHKKMQKPEVNVPVVAIALNKNDRLKHEAPLPQLRPKSLQGLWCCNYLPFKRKYIRGENGGLVNRKNPLQQVLSGPQAQEVVLQHRGPDVSTVLPGVDQGIIDALNNNNQLKSVVQAPPNTIDAMVPVGSLEPSVAESVYHAWVASSKKERLHLLKKQSNDDGDYFCEQLKSDFVNAIYEFANDNSLRVDKRELYTLVNDNFSNLLSDVQNLNDPEPLFASQSVHWQEERCELCSKTIPDGLVWCTDCIKKAEKTEKKMQSIGNARLNCCKCFKTYKNGAGHRCPSFDVRPPSVQPVLEQEDREKIEPIVQILNQDGLQEGQSHHAQIQANKKSVQVSSEVDLKREVEKLFKLALPALQQPDKSNHQGALESFKDDLEKLKKSKKNDSENDHAEEINGHLVDCIKGTLANVVEKYYKNQITGKLPHDIQTVVNSIKKEERTLIDALGKLSHSKAPNFVPSLLPHIYKKHDEKIKIEEQYGVWVRDNQVELINIFFSEGAKALSRPIDTFAELFRKNLEDAFGTEVANEVAKKNFAATYRSLSEKAQFLKELIRKQYEPKLVASNDELFSFVEKRIDVNSDAINLDDFNVNDEQCNKWISELQSLLAIDMKNYPNDTEEWRILHVMSTSSEGVKFLKQEFIAIVKTKILINEDALVRRKKSAQQKVGSMLPRDSERDDAGNTIRSPDKQSEEQLIGDDSEWRRMSHRERGLLGAQRHVEKLCGSCQKVSVGEEDFCGTCVARQHSVFAEINNNAAVQRERAQVKCQDCHVVPCACNKESEREPLKHSNSEQVEGDVVGDAEKKCSRCLQSFVNEADHVCSKPSQRSEKEQVVLNKWLKNLNNVVQNKDSFKIFTLPNALKEKIFDYCNRILRKYTFPCNYNHAVSYVLFISDVDTGEILHVNFFHTPYESIQGEPRIINDVVKHGDVERIDFYADKRTKRVKIEVCAGDDSVDKLYITAAQNGNALLSEESQKILKSWYNEHSGKTRVLNEEVNLTNRADNSLFTKRDFGLVIDHDSFKDEYGYLRRVKYQ